MNARQAATIEDIIRLRQREVASFNAAYFVCLLQTIHDYQIPMPRHGLFFRAS